MESCESVSLLPDKDELGRASVSDVRIPSQKFSFFMFHHTAVDH